MQIKKIKRRDFLKSTGILTASLLASRMPAIAGPFLPGELNGLQIPFDKKLDPQWVRSLYKRGTVTTYFKSKNELQYIGMPVGGITCGTVYLRGDGRLWLWDIFNKNQEGIEPKVVDWQEGKENKKIRPRDGSAYIAPAKNIYPLEQGFAVKIEYEDKSIIKKFQEEDWDEIEFEATYPMAIIRYIDKTLPVEISLQVYSPFIALDEENSGLPASVFSFQFNNKSKKPLKVALLGWLENKAGIYSAKTEAQERFNKTVTDKGFRAVEGSVRNKSNLSNQQSDSKATNIEDSYFSQPDYGSMCIASLNDASKVNTNLSWPFSENSFDKNDNNEAIKTVDEKLIGAVISSHQILPGKTVSSNFVISWFFPNLKLKGIEGEGRYYQNQFHSAGEVAQDIQRNFKKLSSQSKLWKETWYDDSTLPRWFLERTFLNISALASTSCHRFKSGRFYAWEGVGCCPGTCTHVWQYAQSVARIFPGLEKETRENIDLGIALEPNGAIGYRAEADMNPAIDGQAGTILRFYREHEMSADDTFLKNCWKKIKETIQFVLNADKNKDGMEDTPMENTLDAVWSGEISWIVGLCIAAVKAGEMMAEEMNDTAFADECKEYVAKGKKNMDEKLFNGEYFIHRPDTKEDRKHLGSYDTCDIDQVYGQSWAFQVGLERIIDKEKTLSALKSLWKYNYTPDVGPYIKEHPGGRPYALAGEGGMIMNTNPKDEAKPYGEDVTWQVGYFNECMSGFEHQVASHMMAEGMTDEALVLSRTIHDRYHAYKRNPFNEIECSDHYARAMASYGTFVTACGFEYHGPRGYISFAPKWDKENFKAPFITAKGWGSYSQKIQNGKQVYHFEVKYGSLRLHKINLQTIGELSTKKVVAVIGTQKIKLKHQQNENKILLEFLKPLQIQTNQTLIIIIQ
jgi:non-lysosomal glucosylceramidase